MATVFVAHPLAGNMAHHLSEMRQICAKVAEDGDVPICPALYCTQFLNDDDAEQRDLGFYIGSRLMTFCDVVRVYGISPGVRQEIRLAKQLGKVIEYVAQDMDMGED
jgi:hypothetical protein